MRAGVSWHVGIPKMDERTDNVQIWAEEAYESRTLALVLDWLGICGWCSAWIPRGVPMGLDRRLVYWLSVTKTRVACEGCGARLSLRPHHQDSFVPRIGVFPVPNSYRYSVAVKIVSPT